MQTNENIGKVIQPTMKLRWVECEHNMDDNIPYTVVYKWGEASYYKLQQFHAYVGESGGVWQDVEIDYSAT